VGLALRIRGQRIFYDENLCHILALLVVLLAVDFVFGFVVLLGQSANGTFFAVHGRASNGLELSVDGELMRYLFYHEAVGILGIQVSDETNYSSLANLHVPEGIILAVGIAVVCITFVGLAISSFEAFESRSHIGILSLVRLVFRLVFNLYSESIFLLTGQSIHVVTVQYYNITTHSHVLLYLFDA